MGNGEASKRSLVAILLAKPGARPPYSIRLCITIIMIIIIFFFIVARKYLRYPTVRMIKKFATIRCKNFYCFI